jgi:hypothetical protein
VSDYVKEPAEAAAELGQVMKEAAAEVFEEYDLTTSRCILAAATELFINETQTHILPGFRQDMKDMLNTEVLN